MEALSVTGIWMSGVVGMMLVFAVIAIVGILRSPVDLKTGNSQDD